MRIVNEKLLTHREKEIILFLLSGKNKREIASSLNLSISTIKTNVEHLYEKFGVHNKIALAIYVIKNKIIELDEND